MSPSPPLDDIFNGVVALRVTRTLALHPTKEFTGRELAREAHVSPSKAIDALNRLREHGLVVRRTVGPAHLWRFRRDAALAEPLRELFEREHGLDQEIRKTLTAGLRRIPRVQRAVLFGSRARGDANATSDIDLLVIVTHERHKRAFDAAFPDLRTRIEERFGAHLQPVVYSQEEARRKRDHPLLRAAENEGVVLVEATE